ncbi:MAG TPA: VOC family protein, partial [Rubellimicrobium sp.]|nr:VOC family protein [Rubellimicrobium sp.]
MHGVDHLMSVVPSLSRAADAAERLGFTVTERGVHAGRGTSNHLIVLPGCYWELLTVEEETAHNAHIRETQTRPGLLGFALQASTVEAGRRSAGLRGLQVDAPIEVGRPMPGDGRSAQFRIGRTRTGVRFDGFFFYCQHLTPELVWRPEVMDHPNGATSLIAIDVVTGDVRGAARFLSQVVGAPARFRGADATLQVEGVQIRIATTERYVGQHPGAPCAITPGRLGAFVGRHSRGGCGRRAAELLAAGGVSMRETSGGLT